MRSLEGAISTALRAGVTIAAILAGAGGIGYLVTRGSGPGSFAEPPAALRTVGGILRGEPTHRSEWIVALGVLLLIATPVVRVAMLVIAFVLMVLLVSLA